MVPRWKIDKNILISLNILEIGLSDTSVNALNMAQIFQKTRVTYMVSHMVTRGHPW